MDNASPFTEVTTRVECGRRIVHLAVPITVGAVVQTSYHLVNAFWVGRLGADALAVISVCLPINMLLVSLGSGVALAASILVSQYYGAGNKHEINHIAGQALLAVLALALFIGVVGYGLAPVVAGAFPISESLVPAVAGYLRISFLSLVFLMVSALYQAILRGMGEARAPLPITLSSVALNAMLDPLLIFGFGPVAGQGVTGAAWATFLTQVVTALLGLRLMLGARFGLQLSGPTLLPDWRLLKRLFRLGIPASVEQSVQALSASVMTVLIAPFGTVTLAAFGIVFRITTLCIIPSFSISAATSILVGQSLGGGHPAQAIRSTWISAALGCGLMTVLAVVFLLSAAQVVCIFVPGEPALLEKGAVVLQIFALGFPVMAIQLVFSGAFRGSGDTLTTMLLALVGTWVIKIPLTYLLSREAFMGEPGLWWASVISSMISLLISYGYFLSRRWLRHPVGGALQPGTPA